MTADGIALTEVAEARAHFAAGGCCGKRSQVTMVDLRVLGLLDQESCQACGGTGKITEQLVDRVAGTCTCDGGKLWRMPMVFESSLGPIMPISGWKALCVYAYERLTGKPFPKHDPATGEPRDAGEIVAAVIEGSAP